MIRKTPVRMFIEKLYCECGELMEHTGDCLTSFPPQYPHVCPNGHRQNMRVIYPLITHEEVSPNED